MKIMGKRGKGIKNKVRKLREEKKLTQQELSLILNVSRQTIISLEKGNYSPSLHLALRMAKFFGISVEKLFS